MVLGFVFVAWYGKQRQQQRTKQLQQKQQLTQSSPIFGDYLNTALADNDNIDTTGHTQDTDQDVLTLSPHIQHQLDNQVTPTIDTTMPIPPPSQQINLTERVQEAELIIVVTVIAKAGQWFSGNDIALALTSANMAFGDKAIYHHRQYAFSCANLFQPGTLSDTDLADMSTQGVVFFMQLPCLVNGLTLFDAMLDAAQTVAHFLNGELCDDKRNVLSDHQLQRIRSQILTFNLTHKHNNQQFKYDHSS